MNRPTRILFLLCGMCVSAPLHAQLPFYTDDPAVTERGNVHFEFFNEYDVLQEQYPNLRQNTANYKFNYGLPCRLEVDVDFPYLAIYRAAAAGTPAGFGDTNLGIKWNFRKASQRSHLPALGASFYMEFPTGNSRQQLGSGLNDYWLNFIAQEPLSDRTRVNTNLGFLFAGNTSTGAVGIEAHRGHVYTGGISLLHDLNRRVTVGGE